MKSEYLKFLGSYTIFLNMDLRMLVVMRIIDKHLQGLGIDDNVLHARIGDIDFVGYELSWAESKEETLDYVFNLYKSQKKYFYDDSGFVELKEPEKSISTNDEPEPPTTKISF